ncbi:anthocyanidin reductase ((2S)-flavan-3-ol-forming)-like [Hordeum vulgare subsp. vulgare]|uniref:NAD-dependent epimerase/dehydratase domain-containing protein n=1 Tax=Hordeum vulgare subsp. vulgare TaxID=112509 RepID=A0A8I6XSE1_HORVV|nr:anthocyanidin reductase ((2S)-flavan-3-ol-forming)-like [Hordeum vulgare subsp. vulgare]
MTSVAGDAMRRKTACVTGGDGYIASALVKMLLQKGYTVKTTVRKSDDMENHPHLKDLRALGPLEVFRADLEDEGSFDEAVAGSDYAFLVAAPTNLNNAENPEKEVIELAVMGTLNVMRSCVRAGTVKRVILTSSVGAVAGRPLLPGDSHGLDEESWTDVEYLRLTNAGGWAYNVSKVLMEKAAWSFARENGISLVTVCPSVTVGEAPATTVHTSVPCALSLLTGDDEKIRNLELIERASGCIPMVHVQDVCRAMIFVAEEEAAQGRYICSCLDTTLAELATLLATKFPQYNVKADGFGGRPDKLRVCISSAKLVGEGFEFKYKLLDEIYDDVVKYGRSLGILPY